MPRFRDGAPPPTQVAPLQESSQPLGAAGEAGPLGFTALTIGPVLTDSTHTVLNKRVPVQAGSRVRVGVKFYDTFTGATLLPTGVTMRIVDTNGAGPNASPMARNTTTNKFEASVIPTHSGTWILRITVPAPNELVIEDEFYVRGSKM